MHIYRGGIASNNHIDSNGEVLIGEGASAIENYLSHTLVLQESMAYMSSTKVRNGAILVAYGSVEDTSVSSGGSFSIAGNASGTWVYADGTATVQDKGHATSTNLYPGGSMDVLSGGVATITSMGISATMRVRAGGHATSTTVLSSTANMYVSGSGASAWYTILRKGTLHVSDGGFVSYTSAVGSGAVAQICSGGTAVSGLVQADGRIQINVGGSARGISVSSGGRVDNNGIASAIRVSSLGRMDVNDGGFGNTLYINDGGQLHVSSGGSAWGGMTQGDVYVSEGGLVSGMTALGGSDWLGRLDIMFSGLASDVIIKNYGILSVSGGTANVVNISSGGLAQVSSGGQMNGASVSSGGSLSVLDGGFASDTTICSSGLVNVSATGSANGTTVNSSAVLNVLEGGIAQSTTVLDGGRITVSSGGTAIAAEVSSGGRLWVSSGGTATDLIVSNGGCIEVDFDSSTEIAGTHNESAFAGAGGLLSDMTIGANCRIKLGSGGTAARTEVELNGFLRIKEGGKVTDQLTINPGATVSADAGGIVDFDVTMSYPDEEFTIINDISLIQGTPTYTITVLDTQKTGVYRLAGGADEFDQAVSIGTDGSNYGTLTVGGPEVAYGDLTFTLTKSEDELQLTVEWFEPTPISDMDYYTGHFTGAGTARDDVAAYRTDDGLVKVMYPNGGETFAVTDLGAAAPPWQLIGIGDFDANGISDVLWRNMSTGTVGSWLSDGSFGVTWKDMAGAAIGEWEIVGVGDFNADYTDDVLWYNTQTGLMLNWQVQDGEYNVDAIIAGAAVGEWRFSGVGDFNGDGTDDILWHNQISGAGGYWALQDGTYESWNDLAGADPEEWTMIGIGDFDANGYDDVLWLNNATGLVGCWANSSSGEVEWNTLAGAGDLAGWHYEGVGDFNSDGRADVLWAHDAGSIGSWITATDRIAVGSWMVIA